MVNKDKTGTDRQHRRRQREKEWLAANGWKSWEALHTALLKGETCLTQREPDKRDSAASQALSKPKRKSTKKGLS